MKPAPCDGCVYACQASPVNHPSLQNGDFYGNVSVNAMVIFMILKLMSLKMILVLIFNARLMVRPI